MPRPRFSDWLVQDTTVITAGASSIFDIDQIDTFYPQYCVVATYNQTGGTAGLTGTLYPGFALSVSGQQSITYANNGNSITEFSQTLPSYNASSPQTKATAFSADAEIYPRYIRLVLTNLDTANSVSIRIIGDR